MDIILSDISYARFLSEIENDSFENPWSLNAITEELSREDSVSLVAIVDDEAAGYICIRFGYDETELLKVAVKEKFRRKGIARKLIDKGINLCISRNVKSIMLEVDEANSPAVALYTDIGFKEIHRRKNYYKNRSAIIMKKLL